MVAKLKSNVLTLEDQVDSLKADLTEVRRSQSLSSADRDSLAEFDKTETMSQTDRCHDPRYSFSYVYKRNKTRDWVPMPSVDDIAEDETTRETNPQKAASSRSVFRSPERRCYHSCSIAVGKGKLEDHCIHMHASNGVSSVSCNEDTTACNGGERVSGTASELSSDTDVLNDTLSDLVESNSDTSGRVLDVKVRTTVRSKKHIQASKLDTLKLSTGSTDGAEALKPSAGSTGAAEVLRLSTGSTRAAEALTLTLSKTTSSCSTQTDSAEHGIERYAIAGNISRGCFGLLCSFCA